MKNKIKVTYEASNVDGHDFIICERAQFDFCKVNGNIVRLLPTDKIIFTHQVINIQAV